MKLILKFSILIILIFIIGCEQKKIESKKDNPSAFLQVEIFPSQEEHTHGSTIVELPNGDLLAAWFQGHGERWADDVRIMGSRLLKGEDTWSTPFLMADVPGFPDINPVLFIDNKETLWLVWYTVIANRWETSLPKYSISKNYMQKSGAPEWTWQDIIYFKPGDEAHHGIQPNDKFVKSIEEQLAVKIESLKNSDSSDKMMERANKQVERLISKARGDNMIEGGFIYNEDDTVDHAKLGYPYFRRMGWQTKNKPFQIDNRIIIPFYSDGFGFSIMAITDDFGKSWEFSNPLVGPENIQPSMAVKKDGTIVAYMRSSSKRHKISESKDKGMTWSEVKDSNIVNEGSGSDIVTLENGNWVLAYNDTENGRYTLAVSLSEDEGKSWKYTRHIELDLNEDFDKRDKFSYPSIIQGKEGMLHVTYSHQKYNTFTGTPGWVSYDDDTIKYIRFDEDWIRKGDQ